MGRNSGMAPCRPTRDRRESSAGSSSGNRGGAAQRQARRPPQCGRPPLAGGGRAVGVGHNPNPTAASTWKARGKGRVRGGQKGASRTESEDGGPRQRRRGSRTGAPNRWAGSAATTSGFVMFPRFDNGRRAPDGRAAGWGSKGRGRRPDQDSASDKSGRWNDRRQGARLLPSGTRRQKAAGRPERGGALRPGRKHKRQGRGSLTAEETACAGRGRPARPRGRRTVRDTNVTAHTLAAEAGPWLLNTIFH